MYTNDNSKLLPRPVSICEIDRKAGNLRAVYRVTGKNTGTEQFSRLRGGDTIPIIGPLGNGFPLEKAQGKKVFLIGGGIGVPPILELAKQTVCVKKQIVVGYRDKNTFLREEFEENGVLYISTEDGSVGTRGNVLDAVRENALEADVIYACGPAPMLRAVKSLDEYEGEYSGSRVEESGDGGVRDIRVRRGIRGFRRYWQTWSGYHEGSRQCSLAGESDSESRRNLRRHDECHRIAESGDRAVL